MRTFYRFMAKQIPFMWWKFFWLRLVLADLNREKTTAATVAISETNVNTHYHYTSLLGA